VQADRITDPGPAEIALLARMNAQLIGDEGHDNRMGRTELEDRMRWFLDGEYTAYWFQTPEYRVGYALVRTDGVIAYVRHFFIQRGLRRAGLGSAGFKALVGALTMADPALETTMLEVMARNESAIRFYRKLGFADRYRGLELRLAGATEVPAAQPAGKADAGVAERRVGPAADLGSTAGEATLQRITGDTSAAAEFVLNHLKSFNDTVSPYHREAREPGAIYPLAIMLTDAKGAWVGGVTGHAFWDWLEVDDLWVDKSLRGKGYGSQLIRALEDAAHARGARRAHLKTFSFQARGFYEKHGYTVIGELSDYPPGQSFYWMRKDRLG
jgi:ribosomal protein S18 acetylase RimI-like enzyme